MSSIAVDARKVLMLHGQLLSNMTLILRRITAHQCLGGDTDPSSRHSQNAEVFSRRVSSHHTPQPMIYSPSRPSDTLLIKTAALRKTRAPEIEMGKQPNDLYLRRRVRRLQICEIR